MENPSLGVSCCWLLPPPGLSDQQPRVSFYVLQFLGMKYVFTHTSSPCWAHLEKIENFELLLLEKLTLYIPQKLLFQVFQNLSENMRNKLGKSGLVPQKRKSYNAARQQISCTWAKRHQVCLIQTEVMMIKSWPSWPPLSKLPLANIMRFLKGYSSTLSLSKAFLNLIQLLFLVFGEFLLWISWDSHRVCQISLLPTAYIMLRTWLLGVRLQYVGIGISQSPNLVGGFNPFEKYESNWIISPGIRDENKKYLSCHHLAIQLKKLIRQTE